MYCRNCGKEIKEGSAFCGSCGKKISSVDDDKANGRSSYSANKKLSVNSSIKTKRHKRKNKCMQWVIAVCLSIICFIGIIFAMKHNGMLDGLLQRKTILTQGDFTIISEEFTDIVVVDESSAVAAVKDALSLTGTDTADWELTLEEVATINERCIYCIQQSVNGVEVYGRTATVITTDTGEVLGFTSNMVEVGDIEYNSSISQSIVENSVNSYFEKQESEYQDITVQEISDAYQKLYMYEGEMILAYILPIFFGENTQSDTYVILNGSTGEVLGVNETMQSVSRTCFNSSWSINVTGWYEDETYILYDEVRGLATYSYKGTNSKSDKANSTLIKSENEVFGDTLDEKDENQDKGVELLYNVSLIKDYYTDVLNEDGFEMNRLSYEDGYNLGYNALGGTISLESGEVYGSLSIGKNMDISNMDVLAHEYTHIITRRIVNWISTNSEFDQAGAINEAYSDIFAVLITGYLSGEELDWEVETGVLFGALDRNISDPESSGNPVTVTDMTWEAEDFSHEFSTIISHCAYQMYTGNGGVYTSLDDEELAQLWYGTLYLLPSDCSFDDLRDCMELMAEVFGYTEEQQQCVSAAFDNAGISQYYDESITICVKENSGDNYMDYVLQISGTYNTWLGTKTYFECFYPEDNGEIYLQLKEGDYTITVLKDDESQNIEQKSIVVDKGVGANSIVFYTDIYTSYGLDNAEEDLESELQPEETETTAGEVDYSLYTQDSEIETIMLGESSYYDNKGFLYDIDGNGVDELVMLYTTDKVYEGTSTCPTLVTSVYTIQGGMVSCLIYEEVLYTQAGGPYGYVAVVEKDSQNYFVVFREDGETGPGAIRYCVWKRYKIAESFSVQTVMMEEEIRCDITYVDDDCTVITGTGEIGNEVVDYGEYCAYIDGYSIVRKCAEYSEDDGIELAELYYELGGANNQISDVSITTETTFNDETRIKRVTLVNDYLFEKYLEIPVFIESTSGYAKINTFFENMVSSEFSINNESLIYSLQLVEEYPTELESYYQDICTATIGEENAKYVSVRLSYTWFMGGGYNSWADGYTFDVNTGELLVISDVLSESEDEIIDEIYKELEILEKEYGEGSFWWEQIENYDVNDYDFYIINDVMYIHFDVYELAPGVYGDFFITLPFNI